MVFSCPRVRSAEPLSVTAEGGRLRVVGAGVVLLGRAQGGLELVECADDGALLLRPRVAQRVERRTTLAGPLRLRGVDVLDELVVEAVEVVLRIGDHPGGGRQCPLPLTHHVRGRHVAVSFPRHGPGRARSACPHRCDSLPESYGPNRTARVYPGQDPPNITTSFPQLTEDPLETSKAARVDER